MTLDPVDRLILDELPAPLPSGPVVVLDDPSGALTAAIAAQVTGPVRVHCDDLAAQRRVAALGGHTWELSDELFAGAELVVMRLPRALAALQEYAELIAAHADASVRVVGGARVKHMTRSMNAVLAQCFDEVQASLGRQKSRVLHASAPRPVSPQWPRRNVIDIPGPDATTVSLTLCSHGAAFAAGRLDAGTALLLRTLAQRSDWSGRRALDLGCGTGILATWLAKHGAEVTAVDSSFAAYRSTLATAGANQVAVNAQRQEDLGFLTPGSLDVVMCNPPFHRGAAKDSTPAFEMIDAAADVLCPGGELWLVYNAHLPYLSALRNAVGPTEIVTRDRDYLVTRSTRRSDSAS